MVTEDRLYTAEDIYKAFDMGLDSAVFVLEKTLSLSCEDRKYLIKCLKMMTESNK